MLVSLADMKTFLGETTTDYDSFLNLQIQIVSDAVEEYCNRKFAQASYVQTFYLEDFDKYPTQLKLYHFPLIAITTFVEVPESGSNIPVADYRFHKPTAILDKSAGGKFFSNGKKLEITYDAGFATIPALVQGVVYNLVQERYNKKKNGIDLNFGSDVQRVSIPGAISIDFDYSLENNLRKSHLGTILGNNLNVLDSFRSERAIIGDVRLSYVG